MSKVLLAIIVLLVVLLGAYALFRAPAAESPSPSDLTTSPAGPTNGEGGFVTPPAPTE